jgi:hypothetical protein
MAPSPPASLQDLGALVFGDDPLDLEQQVVLRASADRAIEEDDLNAGASELLHQQSLVRMTPGEPVWSEQVDAVDIPGGHCVAQPLQGWPHQGGSAVPLVDKGMIRVHHGRISHDPLAQGGDLAVDRMITRLGLAGDPRVEGGPALSHAQPSLLWPAGRQLPARPFPARPWRRP